LREDRAVTAPTLKGRLLVAAPGLYDPNFDRTVVLMLEQSEDGAVGVVLNRPGDIDVSEPLPAWADVASPPAVVFAGGPVVPDGAIALGRAGEGETPEHWTPLFGKLGLVQLDDAAAGPSGRVEQLRVFAGHSGWTSGQIEAEVAAGGWIVVDFDPGDAFSADPIDLWRHVLARQPGRLAWFANCPPDPRVN
jgi:putative transcriptional regulator